MQEVVAPPVFKISTTTSSSSSSEESEMILRESPLLAETSKRSARGKFNGWLADYVNDEEDDDEEEPCERIVEKKKRSDGNGYQALKRGRPCKSTYVDISRLLTLPQKEAADILGISESMLCKRFKECTRRKWPYRFLRKVEKMIASKEAMFPDEATMPALELEKLEELRMEREKCLEPVSIRLSGVDQLEAAEKKLKRFEGDGVVEQERGQVEKQVDFDDDSVPANILLNLFFNNQQQPVVV